MMMKHNAPPAFVSLDGLLRCATPYERWRTPLHASLRTAMLLSLASTISALLVLWLLPAFPQPARLDVLLVGRDQLAASLAWTSAHRALLAGIAGSTLILQVLGCAISGMLHAARLSVHWLILALVAAGVVHAFVLAVVLAVVLVNVIIWVLLLFSAAYLVARVLWALRRVGKRRNA